MPGPPRFRDDVGRALDELGAQRDLAEGILLAVSGGPDSLALLLAAAPLGRGRAVFAATVDHGLRLEAAEEARFVAARCDELGVPHATLRWRHSGVAGSIQGAAREARYSLLAAHARTLGAGAVLTAHHRRDQIETHLLLKARGARGAALAGMRPWRDLEPGVALVRPFLARDRAELAQAVDRFGWRAVDDPSNHDTRFARVRLRETLGASLVDGLEGGLGEARALRESEDARLAALIRSLVEEGRLTLSADGTVALRMPMRMEVEGVPPRLLSRIVTAVGGGAVPPPVARVEGLRTKLLQHRAATLGGCHLRVRLDSLVLAREFGREGPPSALASEDGVAWFDRRFLVAGLEPGERVEALGGLSRGATRPAIRDADGSPRPVPFQCGVPSCRGGRVHATPTVGWRIWADLPGAPPDRLTHGPQNAANPVKPVGKDLAATYLR